MATMPTNLNPEMLSALQEALKGNLPNNLGSIKARHHIFYHRQTLNATGTTAVLANYSFFNAARARGTTNLPIPQQLPSNNVFIITGVSVFVTAGVNLAFANDDEGETIKVEATAGEAVDCAEFLREIHDCGIVSCIVGDFKLIDDICGLRNFPQGSGYTVSGGGMATTVASTASLAVAGCNGVAVQGNRFTFPNGYPWYAGNSINFSVDFPAAPAAPDAQLVIHAELDGMWISQQS